MEQQIPTPETLETWDEIMQSMQRYWYLTGILSFTKRTRLMDQKTREHYMQKSNLVNIPMELFIELENEIRASTTREIRLYRSQNGNAWLNINFGTKIKIPWCRPSKEVGYKVKAFQVMEFMGLIGPADGRLMNTQEQVDWIKTSCVHGFKGI